MIPYMQKFILENLIASTAFLGSMTPLLGTGNNY